MRVSRQHVLLGVLFVLFGYVVLPYLRPPAGTGAVRETDDFESVDLDLPPEVNMEALSIQREDFNPSGGRNLFAYGQPKPKPPPPGQAPAPRESRPRPRPRPVQQVAATAPPVPVIQLPPQQPARPTPPAIDFKYIGYVGPFESRIAVFEVRTEDGEEIALAREGEVLQTGERDEIQEDLERFLVMHIGFEEVVIGFTEEIFADQSETLAMAGGS